VTEDRLKEQLAFFDYIYPELSRRINNLESENSYNQKILNKALDETRQIKHEFKQYKNKVKRIENYFLQLGIISSLGKNIKDV
jgi:ADP-glucose pyrophosphorylase